MKQSKELTEKEVIETLEALDRGFDIAKFAKGYTQGSFTPYLQNEIIKSINLNVINPDKNKIESALKDPAHNEDTLISYGQSYYFSSLMYKRNIEYLAKLPSFDLEINCVNAESSDYSKPAYKRDEAIVKDFIEKFDYRKEFKRALWNMLNQETYYCIFREFDNKSLLQEFPWKYSKLSGKWEYGLLYDIDMSYFLNPAVDINQYPDWFIKKYKEVFGEGKNKPYMPSAKVDYRDGHFAMWAQTDPTEGFWAFKFTPEHSAQIPFFSPMLPEMAIIPTMRNLQLSQSMAAARKLLVSSIPYLKEKKSSALSDSIAIDADTLGKFLGLATKGLTDAIKAVALPTEDIKGVEFNNTDKETYKNFMAITSSLLSGGKVIFNANERMNVTETQLSMNLDNLLAESIYPQFEDFLNYNINSKTKKFKFAFTFVGSNDYLSRQRRIDTTFQYAEKGVVLPNKLATSLGMNKYELVRELEEAKATDFSSKLSEMLNIYSQGKDDKGGAPKKSDGKISESGANTRQNGNNIEKNVND